MLELKLQPSFSSNFACRFQLMRARVVASSISHWLNIVSEKSMIDGGKSAKKSSTMGSQLQAI